MANETPTMRLGARITLRLRSYVLRPAIRLFDRVWHLFLFIVGAILLTNLLFNVIWSLATTGTTGWADVSQWVVAQQILSHPTQSMIAGGCLLLLAFLGYIGHRASHQSDPPIRPDLVEMYNLSRVQSVSPTPRYIPQYRVLYLPRRIRDSFEDADQEARRVLGAAVHAKGGVDVAAKYGVCTMGRRMLGNTRLVWEAMKAEREIGDWVFVDWPMDAQRHDYGTVLEYLKARGTPVLLWLDNLGKYLSSPNAGLLNHLPYSLSERGLRFAVLATCQEQDYSAAKGMFGELLSHLEIIPLAEITPAQSEQLAAEIAKSGPLAYASNQYDGTPGSIVLGVTHMRDAVYPQLKNPARQALRAVKLLRSAGIADLPVRRVVRVATDLFAPQQEDWMDALRDLATTGFLGQRLTVSGDVLTLSPAQEVYLGVAVPDYGDAPSAAEGDWPRLRESLAAARDAKALLRLGDAFRAKDGDDDAEGCYRAALLDLREQSTPAEWASARLGLGIVLAHRVDESQGKRADPLLQEAQAAFSDAQRVITQSLAPDLWAEAQSGLAAVVRQAARTTKGPQKRQRMLDEAAGNCRAALRILRKETAPDDWADTQYNLARTLHTHAPMIQDARARRDMMDVAIEAYHRALEVYTADYRVQRARVQRYLGEALMDRIASSQKRPELYQRALAAYTDAARLLDNLPGSRIRAEALRGAGDAAAGLALYAEGNEAAALLAEAAEAYRLSAAAFVALHEPVLAGTVLFGRGVALHKQASESDSTASPALLAAAVDVQSDALRVLGRMGTNELRSEIHWELASLKWQQIPTEPVPPSEPAYRM